MKDPEFRKRVIKVAKGAVVAGAAAGIIVFLQFIDAADFGQFDVVVAAFVSVLVNMLRVFSKPTE